MSLIKRYDELYVGYKQETGNPLPLAFLTPYDTTAAFKKRKSTVDDWAKGYGVWNPTDRMYTYPPPIKPSGNIKNEPLSGFKLAHSVRRTGSWNGGNVVWRIEDPRGFEWEIPSENLAQIAIQSGISPGGVFNGRCIIGRSGSANILIPEGTDLWVQMEADMVTREVKSKVKPVTGYSVGQHVKLRNDDIAWYMGHHKLMLGNRYPARPVVFEPGGVVESENRYHLFINVGDTNFVRAYANNPVVEILDNTVSTHDETLIMTKGRTHDKMYITFAGKAQEISQYVTSIV